MSSDLESSRRVRFVGRFVVVQLVLALLLVFSSAAPASASVGWCKSDPIVVVNLTLADVFSSAQIQDLSKVTGSTRIVLVTPMDVFATLATPGLGFGYGEFVTFQRSPYLHVTRTHIDVIVKVFVPSTDSSMPIRVYFAPRIVGLLQPMSAEGHANSWVVLRSSM
jgi:uncharacterized membrane protein YjdF